MVEGLSRYHYYSAVQLCDQDEEMIYGWPRVRNIVGLLHCEA